MCETLVLLFENYLARELPWLLLIGAVTDILFLKIWFSKEQYSDTTSGIHYLRMSMNQQNNLKNSPVFVLFAAKDCDAEPFRLLGTTLDEKLLMHKCIQNSTESYLKPRALLRCRRPDNTRTTYLRHDLLIVNY